MLKCAVFLTCVLSSLAVVGNEAKERPNHRSLDATLWVQCASEWRAHCQQTYNSATRQLKNCLKDTHWTAAIEQEDDPTRNQKIPAIVIDIDETVLDNSPYQARLILADKNYNDGSWAKWVHECQASAVPGALRFLRAADKLGIEIFYVTNRWAELEESTRKNLQAEGFPLNKSRDTVLSKGEKPDWTSDKNTRRRWIARTHRIVMLIGDDFADFTSAARRDNQTRKRAESKYQDLWGQGWFLLPNPIYGSWRRALTGFKNDLSTNERDVIEFNALDPRRR